MKRIVWLLMVGLVGACAMDDVAEPASSVDDEDETEGTDPVDLEGLPEHPGNDVCGDATVASSRADNGNRIVYCVGDGVEIIGELAPIGGGSAIEQLELDFKGATCALDAFLATTSDDTAVPAALVRACENKIGAPIDELGRAVVEAPVFAADPADDAATAIVPYTNYCRSGDQTRFFEQECLPLMGTGGKRFTSWCHSGAATYHQKTLSYQMGGDGNWAVGRVASCGGSTRWQALRRTNNWQPWSADVIVDVPAGWSWNTRMLHEAAPFDHGSDFRFRGDSYPGAWHRYAGRFEDWL